MKFKHAGPDMRIFPATLYEHINICEIL